MTQDRRFKRRVRARIAKTGESYSTAYHHLRNRNVENEDMAENEFQTITNHDFGYEVSVPATWRDVGPDIYNSAFEVARYLRKAPSIHDGIVNIFWGIPGPSRRDVAERGDASVFDLNKESLEKEGIKDISLTEVLIGDRKATRLDHAYRLGDIENWASRSYFIEVRETIVCLNMGSSDADKDRAVYDRIASSFSAIEDCIGIVLVADGKTPEAFVSQLLVDKFDYPPRKATQRVVRMATQHESVVALVQSREAKAIVESINELCRQEGHGLTCRVASQV